MTKEQALESQRNRALLFSAMEEDYEMRGGLDAEKQQDDDLMRELGWVPWRNEQTEKQHEPE